MKRILITILLAICYLFGQSQTYNPAQSTVSNKPYGMAQFGSTDARAYFYDATNFVYRPYVDTAEILSYLNLSKYRSGQVLYIVNTGGVLSNGVITGGSNSFWYFKNGQADVDLVPFTAGGGGSGTLTNLTSTTAAGITLTITNPTTTPNITPSVTLGGDISGSSLSAVTVAKFNGLPPAYYLNYNNLTNLPTIPAQFNPIAGSGISLSGTYPNITFTSTASGITAGTYITLTGGGSIVNLDTLNYRKVDSIWMLNDSVMIYTINHRNDTLNIPGGTGAGGGGGTGTVTIVTGVNLNGIAWSITNPTTTPALTITLGAITPTTVNALTLAAGASQFTIIGGSGTPRTLTVVGNATISGTNTGDITIAGQNYLSLTGQVLTANPVDVSGTNITGILKAASEPAHTGDVTNSAGSLAMTIANGVVTYAKMQTETTQTFLGRHSAGTGVVQENTFAGYFAFNASTGVVTLNGIASIVAGDLIYGDGSVANQWNKLSASLVNQRVLTNSAGSGIPSWGQVSLTAGVSGILPIANGGNGTATPVSTAGYGVLITGSWNNYTYALDTANVKDTLYLDNVGATGVSLASSISPTHAGVAKLIAGANIFITGDSSTGVIITGTAGSGAGITNVGAYDSQPANSTGSTISGTDIYFQSATAAYPGMIKASGAQTLGATLTFAVAPSISTLTTNGGVTFLNASGTFQQAGAGTSVQVLHGGVSPAMGAVVLTTDVSGILPVANGGNGTATPSITAGAGISVTGSWGGYTITNTAGGSVTSVAASGGSTGMSFTGSPITTSGTLTLTGTLVPSNGGTGLSSLTPYAVIVAGTTATGTFQQVPGGSIGQVLTYQGASAVPTWTTFSGLTNPMTTFGDMIVAAVAGVPTRLPGAAHAGMKLTYTGSGLGVAWQDTTSSKIFATVSDSVAAENRYFGQHGYNFTFNDAYPAGAPGLFTIQSYETSGGSGLAAHFILESSIEMAVSSSLFASSTTFSMNYLNMRLTSSLGTYYIDNLADLALDSTTYALMVVNKSTGQLKTMAWPTFGGGSSLTRQNITSGTSATVTAGNYLVQFNFSTLAATYTLTLPASPSDQDIVEIQTGTTITAGNLEITSFTLSANAGQTLNFVITPATLTSGEVIRVRYNSTGTFWDRLY